MYKNLNSSLNNHHHDDQYSSDYQPPRKLFIQQKEANAQPCYTILKGPDNPTQTVHCQIILVNIRQRFFFYFRTNFLLMKKKFI